MKLPGFNKMSRDALQRGTKLVESQGYPVVHVPLNDLFDMGRSIRVLDPDS